MYEIVAKTIYKNGKEETLVSDKKFKTYNEAKLKAEIYIETIPNTTLVKDYYIREVKNIQLKK